MSRLPLAIVLGIDTPIGLTVVRELGAHGVRVHGVGRRADAIGRSSRWCSSFAVRPPGALAIWLPEMIRATRARALLAISEDDLIALAELDAVIGECRILTPRRAPLSIALDKARTLEAARPLGIDVPCGWQPLAGEDFAARAVAIDYPVILKWRDPPTVLARLEAHGIAFKKAEYIAGPGALLDALARYNTIGTWPLVQAYCPGKGLGQMFHMAHGRATLVFQHERIHEWPPEGGVSSLCKSVSLDRHAAQRARSEALLQAIGWEGAAMVEYRFDVASGRYWLMEINGRFWGSLPLASHAGAPFAWETYAQAMLGGTRAQPSIRPRRARYMIPETRRLARVMFGPKSTDAAFAAMPWRDLLMYVGGFFDPRMRYFVWQWRDPGPFFADMRNIIRKAVRRETPAPD